LREQGRFRCPPAAPVRLRWVSDLYLVDPGPGVRIDVNRTLNLRSVLLAFSLVILIFRLDAFSVWIHTHRSEVVQKAALWNERDDQIRKR
jgi:hypothetical protein